MNNLLIEYYIFAIPIDFRYDVETTILKPNVSVEPKLQAVIILSTIFKLISTYTNEVGGEVFDEGLLVIVSAREINSKIFLKFNYVKRENIQTNMKFVDDPTDYEDDTKTMIANTIKIVSRIISSIFDEMARGNKKKVYEIIDNLVATAEEKISERDIEIDHLFT